MEVGHCPTMTVPDDKSVSSGDGLSGDDESFTILLFAVLKRYLVSYSH